VVDRNAAVEIGQDSSAVLIDREQEISSRREVEADDVLAVGKGKGIGGVARKSDISNCGQKVLQFSSMDNVLYKIKDRDTIAYRREQAGAIGSKEQVALAVDCPQKIGELKKRVRQQFLRSIEDHTNLEVCLHFPFATARSAPVKNSSFCSQPPNPKKDKPRISDSPVPHPKGDSGYANPKQARPGILQKTKGDSGGSKQRAAHRLSPFHSRISDQSSHSSPVNS
jgi:hypothetical protein